MSLSLYLSKFVKSCNMVCPNQLDIIARRAAVLTPSKIRNKCWVFQHIIVCEKIKEGKSTPQNRYASS